MFADRSLEVLSMTSVEESVQRGLLFLRLHTPQSDLTVVQSNLVYYISRIVCQMSIPLCIGLVLYLPALIDWVVFSCDAILSHVDCSSVKAWCKKSRK